MTKSCLAQVSQMLCQLTYAGQLEFSGTNDCHAANKQIQICQFSCIVISPQICCFARQQNGHFLGGGFVSFLVVNISLWEEFGGLDKDWGCCFEAAVLLHCQMVPLSLGSFDQGMELSFSPWYPFKECITQTSSRRILEYICQFVKLPQVTFHCRNSCQNFNCLLSSGCHAFSWLVCDLSNG